MPRILVADDNTNIQKMVTLAFQERGVEVIAVGNGEAAVRRIPDANPDLVLADVFMPVRNGYEVCEFVKKDSRFSQTPVILLVGAFDPLDEKEARRVGADGVLKKPFVPPDPLIAMVMSALEKNPRVMAEWAKAKEVAAAPVEVPRALENPANAEPKPLPHFPEPTPEEAAVIYGFGKGLRGLDADEEESGKEAAAPAAPAVAAGPKASADNGPKVASGPKISVVGADDDEEESFDDMATATDRRRQNADFEVPDNVSADPIYSYGRDFEPITFPSEKDVPPKHVKGEKDNDTEVIEAAQVAELKSAPALEVVPPPVVAPVVAAESKEEETSEWDIRPATESTPVAVTPAVVDEVPAVELVSGEVAHEEAPAPFSISSATQTHEPEPAPLVFAPKPLPERVFEAARAALDEATPGLHKETPASAPQQVAHHDEHTPAAAASTDAHESTSRGGWMDMMSPLPTPAADNHWMESLTSPAPAAVASETPLAVEATSHVAEPEVVEAPVVEAVSHVEAETAAPAPMEDLATTAHSETSEAATSHAAPDWADQLAAAPAIDLGGQFSTEPRSFSGNVPQFGSTSYHFSNGENATGHEHFASGTKEEAVAEVPEHVAAESTPEISSELMVAPADAPPAAIENTVEAEAAPAEPVYVNEAVEEAPSGYAAQQEESLPVEQAAAEPQAEPAFAEGVESPNGFFAPTPSSMFESSESVATAPDEDYTERMPTLPPTNREALSDIAFLMPPPNSHEISASNGASAHESSYLETQTNGSALANTAVDDVVRKVLEKLTPQLQEMLAQGMKPLLENMVQNELQKKDR